MQSRFSESRFFAVLFRSSKCLKDISLLNQRKSSDFFKIWLKSQYSIVILLLFSWTHWCTNAMLYTQYVLTKSEYHTLCRITCYKMRNRSFFYNSRHLQPFSPRTIESILYNLCQLPRALNFTQALYGLCLPFESHNKRLVFVMGNRRVFSGTGTEFCTLFSWKWAAHA